MGKVACALALPGSVKANGDGEADIEIPPEVVRLSQVGILGLESLVFVGFVVRAQSRLSRGGGRHSEADFPLELVEGPPGQLPRFNRTITLFIAPWSTSLDCQGSG